MVYRPYNLLGPKLINAIVEQIQEAQKAGSRAIVIRSGLRHFSAGADLDIFDKRVEEGSADQGGENRRLSGVEFLRVKEMSMLARRYDAPTLEKWGLINLTVPEESLETTTMAIAEEFAQGPTVAHAATKELVYIAANDGVAAADEAMAR